MNWDWAKRQRTVSCPNCRQPFPVTYRVVLRLRSITATCPKCHNIWWIDFSTKPISFRGQGRLIEPGEGVMGVSLRADPDAQPTNGLELDLDRVPPIEDWGLPERIDEQGERDG